MQSPPISVPPGVSLLHPESVPERSGVAATWSHVKREGQWVLPRHFRALAIMGGVDLDLTQVILGEESEIECVAIMGGVKIIIPQGIHVICDGDATFGSFGIKDGARYPAPPDAPVIRIVGTAFMGGVEVTIWNPDQSGWLGRFLKKDDSY